MAARLLLNPAPGPPGLVVLPEGGARRAAGEIAAWAPEGEVSLHAAGGTLIWNEGARFGLGCAEGLGIVHAALRLAWAALARAGVSTDPAALFAGGVPGAAGLAFAPLPGVQGQALARAAARMGAGLAPEGLRLPIEARAGETEPVRDMMQGLRAAVGQALEAAGEAPTHLLAEGGALAAAAAAEARARFGRAAPRVIVLERGRAPLFAAASGQGGEPCLLAWQELSRSAFAFCAAPEGMPLAALPLGLESGARLLAIGAFGEAS